VIDTPGLRPMNSAMALASTESFMVTPHWCEIVCSKVMSFIALKMLSCEESRAANDMMMSP
jgi:hypothetical protein